MILILKRFRGGQSRHFQGGGQLKKHRVYKTKQLRNSEPVEKMRCRRQLKRQHKRWTVSLYFTIYLCTKDGLSLNMLASDGRKFLLLFFLPEQADRLATLET